MAGGPTWVPPASSAWPSTEGAWKQRKRRGSKGVREGSVIGTYLHGPLLPKNAWFADWLIATALRLTEPMTPLNDDLEAAAHREARRAAGI